MAKRKTVSSVAGRKARAMKARRAEAARRMKSQRRRAARQVKRGVVRVAAHFRMMNGRRVKVRGHMRMM